MAMAHSKKCELTDLSRTCILHTLSVLRGQDESESIESVNKFCKRLYQAVQYKRSKDSGGVDSEKSLDVDSRSVKSYCDGRGGSAEKLLFKIELELSECAVDDFVEESLFKACWEVYHEHKQPWPEQIVVEFSSHCLRESVYNLWLVFNAIVPSESGKLTTPANNLDVLMKRMYDLCGHACSREELGYGSTVEIDFLGYVKIVARYQRKFNLNPKLTSEVIQDLRDEVVDAILKKSYLTKRGHKVKNWKRRWFVLWKTVMRYFECKERPVLKGQIVLNATTEVREAPDGRWRHCFEVVCGKTMKRYKISADDEKSRHAWIMAIKKAIDLARILSGREPIRKISIPSNPLLAANFYLTRFQASHSLIPKWEGAVKKVFDFGEENVSEEETEDGVHFRSKPRSKSSLTDDSITIPIPKPRSSSDPKSVRASSDYSILSEQSPGNFQLDGQLHTFKRVTSGFINDNIHHIVAITDDGYVVVPKSVGEDVGTELLYKDIGAQECTSILNMPEESTISILTKAAPEKMYIPVKDDGTGAQYIDRMRSFSRSLSELDKIQGSMFGNDYLKPLTDQGGVKELSKSTQSLSFKSPAT